MDPREVSWGGMYYIHLAQDSDQPDTVLSIRVPQDVENCLYTWATGGFSRRTQFHVDSWAYDASVLVHDYRQPINGIQTADLQTYCQAVWLMH
jgi:hypothetical protein